MGEFFVCAMVGIMGIAAAQGADIPFGISSDLAVGAIIAIAVSQALSHWRLARLDNHLAEYMRRLQHLELTCAARHGKDSKDA